MEGAKSGSAKLRGAHCGRIFAHCAVCKFLCNRLAAFAVSMGRTIPG